MHVEEFSIIVLYKTLCLALSNDDDLDVGSVSYVGELNVSLIPKPLISQLVVSVGISPTYCK